MNLTELDLSWNRLSSLPVSLRALKNLSKLNLRHVASLSLEALAVFLGGLTAIQELDLQNCRDLDISSTTLGALIRENPTLKKLQ